MRNRKSFVLQFIILLLVASAVSYSPLGKKISVKDKRIDLGTIDVGLYDIVSNSFTPLTTGKKQIKVKASGTLKVSVSNNSQQLDLSDLQIKNVEWDEWKSLDGSVDLATVTKSDLSRGHYSVWVKYKYTPDVNDGPGSYSVTLSYQMKNAGQPQMIISKLLPNPEGGDFQEPYEYIVLKNIGEASVDIKNWELTDSQGDNYKISGKTILSPDETLKIKGKDYNPSGNDNKFKLANDGDTITLTDSTGATVDSCQYENANEGEIINCHETS